MASALEPGVLSVTLERAYDLKDMDLLHKMDPYVVITCGRIKLLSSVHKRGGVNPVWHETFKVGIGSTEKALEFKIMDKDRFLADDVVGKASLDLQKARQMRGQTVMLPVMRKQKQRGNLQVAVSFAAFGNNSSTSVAPTQQAAEQADARPMGFCTTSSTNSTATGLWARLNSIGNRSTTPDHPQQRDQISTCPSNVSSVAVALAQQQAQGGQAAELNSTAMTVAPLPMQPSTTPTGHNNTTSSVTGAPHYPAVVSPCPGWPQANSTCPPSDAQSLLSSTAPPRTVDDCGRSEASYSVVSMSTLSRADSGDTSCTSVDPRVTELVRCSVDFRSELEQLLKMLKVAEQETSSSITWTERQIEQVAKEGGPAMCALINQLAKQKEASEHRQQHLQQRMGMLSFSIDELSKLEQLLHVLHLPVDEASELQAGVMNRLMDVYYKLQLQANHPELAQTGRLVPVSLVDQLRGAANNAAADGRPLSQEDWGKILADFNPLAPVSSQASSAAALPDLHHGQWATAEGMQELRDQQLQQGQQQQVLLSSGQGPLQPRQQTNGAGSRSHWFLNDTKFKDYDLNQMMQVLQQAVDDGTGQQQQQGIPGQQQQQQQQQGATEVLPLADQQGLLPLFSTSSLEEGMLAPDGQPLYLLAGSHSEEYPAGGSSAPGAAAAAADPSAVQSGTTTAAAVTSQGAAAAAEAAAAAGGTGAGAAGSSSAEARQPVFADQAAQVSSSSSSNREDAKVTQDVRVADGAAAAAAGGGGGGAGGGGGGSVLVAPAEPQTAPASEAPNCTVVAAERQAGPATTSGSASSSAAAGHAAEGGDAAPAAAVGSGAGAAAVEQPLQQQTAAGHQKQQQQPAAQAAATRPPPPPPPPPPALQPTQQQQQHQQPPALKPGSSAAAAAAPAGPAGPKPAPPPPPPPGAKAAPPPPPPPPPLPGKLGPAAYMGPKPPPIAPGIGAIKRHSDFEKVQDLITIFRVMTGLTKQDGGPAVVVDAAAEQDARANLKAELEKKLGRQALIQQNYEERRKDLLVWAAEVKRFSASSMQQLQCFVDGMEANLRTLVDEQAVLKLMGEDWPEKRYDDFLLACKEFEKLQGLRTDIEAWERPAALSSQAVMGLLQRKFTAVQWTLQAYDKDREMLQKRFKAQQIPFPAAELRDDVRKASLKLTRAYVAEVLQEVASLSAKQPPPQNLQQRQLQVLKEGTEFLFRSHQLVAGFDTATKESFKDFATVLKLVQEGTYNPAAALPVATAAASVPAAAAAAAADNPGAAIAAAAGS